MRKFKAFATNSTRIKHSKYLLFQWHEEEVIQSHFHLFLFWFPLMHWLFLRNDKDTKKTTTITKKINDFSNKYFCYYVQWPWNLNKILLSIWTTKNTQQHFWLFRHLYCSHWMRSKSIRIQFILLDFTIFVLINNSQMNNNNPTNKTSMTAWHITHRNI